MLPVYIISPCESDIKANQVACAVMRLPCSVYIFFFLDAATAQIPDDFLQLRLITETRAQRAADALLHGHWDHIQSLPCTHGTTIFCLVYFPTFDNLIVFVLDLLSHQDLLWLEKSELNPSSSAPSCYVFITCSYVYIWYPSLKAFKGVTGPYACYFISLMWTWG